MIRRILSKAWSTLWSGTRPIAKSVYAINTGDYLGEFFVYVCEDQSDYCFLSLPKMEPRRVPKDKFEFGVKNEVIELVEGLPAHVYNVCKAQYYVDTSNRQQQPPVQDLVDKQSEESIG